MRTSLTTTETQSRQSPRFLDLSSAYFSPKISNQADIFLQPGSMHGSIILCNLGYGIDSQ